MSGPGCMMCGSLGRKVPARVGRKADAVIKFFDSVRRRLVRTPADGKQIHLAERLFLDLSMQCFFERCTARVRRSAVKALIFN